MITTTHRVEITVDEKNVPHYFTSKYSEQVGTLKNRPTLQACGSSFAHGSITEWAVYGSIDDAVVVHEKLNKFLE